MLRGKYLHHRPKALRKSDTVWCYSWWISFRRVITSPPPDRWGGVWYLYGHGGEVPHVDHDGPAGHHPEQVAHHVVFAAVPESVAEARVVLRHTESRSSVTNTRACSNKLLQNLSIRLWCDADVLHLLFDDGRYVNLKDKQTQRVTLLLVLFCFHTTNKLH